MVEDFINKIFLEKIRLESIGFSPKVIVIQGCVYDKIYKEWIKNIRELPYGDTICYEAERQKDKNIFLADGCLFNLWVIKSNIIEGFEIY